VEESEKIMETLRRGESDLSSLVDSWGYVRWHTRRTDPSRLNLHRGTRAMLQIALDAAAPLLKHDDGLVCEFGVATGRSMRMTQELLPLDVPIHGFDTFTGLPVAWGNEPAGSYSTGGAMPKMEQGDNVVFHKGLFRDTIPRFLSTVDKGRPLAYANVDCDLYGSTRDVLEAFHGRIIPGTVLVFDEYLCHPTWRNDEFRAWRECCVSTALFFVFSFFSPPRKYLIVADFFFSPIPIPPVRRRAEEVRLAVRVFGVQPEHEAGGREGDELEKRAVVRRVRNHARPSRLGPTLHEDLGTNAKPLGYERSCQ
jgi:hypothetical protein